MWKEELLKRLPKDLSIEEEITGNYFNKALAEVRKLIEGMELEVDEEKLKVIIEDRIVRTENSCGIQLPKWAVYDLRDKLAHVISTCKGLVKIK